MRVVAIPCLKDNYAYLVIGSGGEAVVVDPSEAAPVLAAMRREGGRMQSIWCTHHHLDHVGGIAELSRNGALPVVGHSSDRGRIPAFTHGVDDGDIVRVGDLEARCLHVPGHTAGAVSYFVSDGRGDSVIFTGDTLFVAGCGRLFEGTARQMQASLTRLLELPGETRLYCGHEYTEANLRFASALEPSNEDVARARRRTERLRAVGMPSVGTELGSELRYNPFLRVRSPELRFALGIPAEADDVAAFAAVRAAKDAART
ncbi:MAG: hydroxyacylglutathione hydrolase [Myxococcota bacterium]|nr:hydroxyacylglutathione hydrolase [Myxococcota bacterium]